MQRWCPNCTYFSKELGMNNCILVDWALHPKGERTDIMEWLHENTREDTHIFDTADGCPGFEPYPELAQKGMITADALNEELNAEVRERRPPGKNKGRTVLVPEQQYRAMRGVCMLDAIRSGPNVGFIGEWVDGEFKISSE